MTNKQLQASYESICNLYIKAFCKKQELDFDGWVCDEIGGIASFCCQYFFSISEIKLDIDTKQPKGLILDWQNDGVEYYFKTGKKNSINYKSYTIGLRFDDLKK